MKRRRNRRPIRHRTGAPIQGVLARERAGVFSNVPGDLNDQVPMIPIWYNRRISVYNSDLRNYRPAHAVTSFWNPWEWEI